MVTVHIIFVEDPSCDYFKP